MAGSDPIHAPFTHPAKIIRALGISPRKRFSQNFLCQPALARRIVSLADWPADSPVLEVGAGTGFLTDAIRERYERVWAIELDRALAEFLRERFSGSGVTVLEADARTLDVATVCPSPMGLFGNLPYGITTDLLMWLFRQRAAFHGAVVMVQKEYAERLTATPGTKAYGSLTVFAAFRLRVRQKLSVGPGAFHPEPGVGSTVLACDLLDGPKGVDPGLLERIVRAAFSHRRKLVRSNLSAGLGIGLVEVKAVLAAIGVAEKARAETVTPEQYLELAARLRIG